MTFSAVVDSDKLKEFSCICKKNITLMYIMRNETYKLEDLLGTNDFSILHTSPFHSTREIRRLEKNKKICKVKSFLQFKVLKRDFRHKLFSALKYEISKYSSKVFSVPSQTRFTRLIHKTHFNSARLWISSEMSTN